MKYSQRKKRNYFDRRFLKKWDLNKKGVPEVGPLFRFPCILSYSFKNLVRTKSEESGLEYLKKHIMSKGKEIIYMNIYIGNYLASNSILTI